MMEIRVDASGCEEDGESLRGETSNMSRSGKKEEKRVSPCWSSLPDDLLRDIYHRLLEFRHRIAFRGICASWRSFSLLRNPSPQFEMCNPPIPQLMLPLDFGFKTEFNSEGDVRRTLLSIGGANCVKVHHLNLPGAAIGKFCCGSSQGFLVLLNNHNLDPSICLLNPVTGAQIRLPCLTNLPRHGCVGGSIDIASKIGKGHHQRFFLFKVVISPNPTPNDYTAMAIFGIWSTLKNLAFCKSGQNNWTLIPGMRPCDVIHHHGQFYISEDGGPNVFVITNLQGSNPSPVPIRVKEEKPGVRMLAPLPPNSLKEQEILSNSGDDGRYLVDLSGELAIVVREPEFLQSEKIAVDKYVEWSRTKQFHIFKYDSGSGRWALTMDIGDHALFAGANSVIATKSPPCRSNCVYFTNDFLRRSHRTDASDHLIRFEYRYASFDFGIFDIDTASAESFPSLSPALPYLRGPPPIWLTPSLF